MTALTEVVRAGKVRWIGFSEWPAKKICAALAQPNVAQFVSSQPQYSLLWRQPEHEIFPLCRTTGISQIVWSPLAQGVLTGKYRPGKVPPAGTRASSPTMGAFFRKGWLEPQILGAVEHLRPLAESAGLTMSQFALAWLLREPSVAAPIIGATRPEQIEENAAASGRFVDPTLFAKAELLLGDAAATS